MTEVIMITNLKQKIKQLKQAKAKLVYDNFVSGLNTDLKDNVWYSSAKNLENSLKFSGVTQIPKLYYEYKFPNNLKNFELDRQTLFTRCFPAIYENYLESFNTNKTKVRLFEDAAANKKTDLSAFFGFCICLGLSRLKDLKSVFKETYDQSMNQVYFLAEYIHQHNPELQHIKNYKNLDFVNGAIYGFAPKEIEFFLNLQERRKNGSWDYEMSGKDEEVNYVKNNMDKISDFTGNQVTYFLSPETGDKIIAAIEKYQSNMQTLHRLNDFVNY